MSFFYIIGVYETCLFVHHVIRNLPEIAEDTCKLAMKIHETILNIREKEADILDPNNSKKKVTCKLDRIGF